MKIKSSNLKMQKQSQNKKGFTLIETMVAITILLIGIVTPLQIAANALNSTYAARDQITAYYLAAEAIEYVKNVRDSKFLQDVAADNIDGEWMAGLQKCESPSSCLVDPLATDVNDTIQSCDSEAGDVPCDKPLNFDDNTGVWSYDTGSPSRFTRVVTIKLSSNDSAGTYTSDGEPAPNHDEAIIDVTVTWPDRALLSTKSFSLKGVMMNWQRK